MSEAHVREARAEDAVRIWEIRNSRAAREVSGSANAIPLKEHLAWFKRKYAPGSGNLCYVLESAGSVAGYCRLDRDRDGFMVSIALDPARQGRGLGSRLLSEAVTAAAAEGSVRALVRTGNAVSLRLFEKNGFVRESEDAEYVRFRYHPPSP